MRLNVALLRNQDAVEKAREKAETPTVKTEEQVRREDELRAKYGTTAKDSHPVKQVSASLWRRRFRPLSEAKAVDLFADVIGDAFILIVASSLLIFEYWRQAGKPDANLERIKELNARLDVVQRREEELAEAERRHETRVRTIEDALRAFKDPKTKKPLLATPPPTDATDATLAATTTARAEMMA